MLIVQLKSEIRTSHFLHFWLSKTIFRHIKWSRLVQNSQNIDCLKKGFLPVVLHPDKSGFQLPTLHYFSFNSHFFRSTIWHCHLPHSLRSHGHKLNPPPSQKVGYKSSARTVHPYTVHPCPLPFFSCTKSRKQQINEQGSAMKCPGMNFPRATK